MDEHLSCLCVLTAVNNTAINTGNQIIFHLIFHLFSGEDVGEGPACMPRWMWREESSQESTFFFPHEIVGTELIRLGSKNLCSMPGSPALALNVWGTSRPFLYSSSANLRFYQQCIRGGNSLNGSFFLWKALWSLGLEKETEDPGWQ